MKTFRSSFLRPWGTLVHGLWILAMVVGGWFGFLWLTTHTPGKNWRLRSCRGLLEDPAFLVPAALIAVIGLWIVLHKFGSNRGRYRAGARELEIRNGLVWQSVWYLRYTDITGIAVREGPLMRLLGTGDLVIVVSSTPHRAIVLHGVPAAEEVRRFLLERRDSLCELASEKK